MVNQAILNYRDPITGNFTGFQILKGDPGTIIRFTTAVPAIELGQYGDYVFAEIDNIIYLYGPKVVEGWGEGIRITGLSLYQVWLELGNVGSEEDFLLTLKGDTRAFVDDDPAEIHVDTTSQGLTAYDIPFQSVTIGEYLAANPTSVVITESEYNLLTDEEIVAGRIYYTIPD